MDVIAIVFVLAALLFGTLWLRARKRLRNIEGRVERAEEIIEARKKDITQLNVDLAQDGNRLSELRSQNRDLTKRRDEAVATNTDLANRNCELLSQLHQANAKLVTAETKIADLQPLADKAIAAQAQRLRASQISKNKAAERRLAKATPGMKPAITVPRKPKAHSK